MDQRLGVILGASAQSERNASQRIYSHTYSHTYIPANSPPRGWGVTSLVKLQGLVIKPGPDSHLRHIIVRWSQGHSNTYRLEHQQRTSLCTESGFTYAVRNLVNVVFSFGDT